MRKFIKSDVPTGIEALIENWTYKPETDFNTLMDFVCPRCTGALKPVRANMEAVGIFHDIAGDFPILMVTKAIKNQTIQIRELQPMRFETIKSACSVRRTGEELEDLIARVIILCRTYHKVIKNQTNSLLNTG